MQLESPPLLELLFLESPWAVMVVCLVAAVILFSSGQRRHKRGLLFGSGVAVGVALGVYILAGAVTTDREQLIQNTSDLVASTSPLDSAVLNRLIDPGAVVTGPDGAVWLNAGEVMPRLERVLNRITINSQAIRTVNALAHDDVRGESIVTVRTDAGGSGVGPINTGWRLFWQCDNNNTGDTSGDTSGGTSGGGWRVVDIRWMRFNGLATPQAVMP
jgi:hypothetical protein